MQLSSLVSKVSYQPEVWGSKNKILLKDLCYSDVESSGRKGLVISV